MNITIEAKDVVLLLIGVAGSVIANYIYKYLQESGSSAQQLTQDLQSSDPTVKAKAIKRCLYTAARFYLFANIFWVVSGAAWIFGGADYGISSALLAGSSAIAIFLFWLALQWLQRAQGSDGA